MRDEEIDRILREEEIVPSPGFPARVMAAVRREAEALPPIVFPWKRAVPALAAAVFALAVSTVLLVESGAAEAPFWDALLPAARSLGAPWIAVATLATAVSLLLSRRLAEERY